MTLKNVMKNKLQMKNKKNFCNICARPKVNINIPNEHL